MALQPFQETAFSWVVTLIDEYAHSSVGEALGHNGEMLTLGAFAEGEFVQRGRETRSFSGRKWSETNHDLDFIFERDALTYGVEVKNTLAYPDQREIRLKVRLARHIRITPVFVVRMMPKSWIFEVVRSGGFVLVLKYQIYPFTHRELAKRVANTFKMPVDAPRRLSADTIRRFVKWHEERVNSIRNSQSRKRKRH